MAFCSNCGYELVAGAKFCSECGAPVDVISLENNRRKTVYDGVIHKCPNCGETLDSFMASCPACGYEFRGTAASSAVKEFELRFKNAENINEKIDLIKTFSIPNTKEDIVEFMILAESNITPSLYEDPKGNAQEIKLSAAWETKYEQAYQKATRLFPDANEIEQYQTAVTEKQKQIESIKRTHEKKRGREKTRQGISRFLMFLMENGSGIILIGLSVFLIASIVYLTVSANVSHEIKEDQLEQLVGEVEVLIEEGNYEKARVKASQIVDDTGWSTESREKWDSTRESLIDSIDRQEATSLGKIQIGIGYEALKKMDSQEAESYLSKRGFTNIKLEPISDLITGWIIKEGEIEEITAGGSNSFTADDYFSPNVKIVISYHTLE